MNSARPYLLVLILCLASVQVVTGQQVEQEAGARLEFEQNTIELVERYGPSVVAINVVVNGRRTTPEAENDGREPPPPLRQAPPRQGSGSGFVVDDEFHIVTNYHVVQLALQEGSVELRSGAHIDVIFPGSDQPLSARVVGANALYDLALLALNDPETMSEHGLTEIHPLRLARSDEVRVGQKAVAIGNPFGFENSVTVGTVSGLSRSLPGVGQIDIPLIQTDTAINPGNSGGPLIDSFGNVIGVNTAIVPGMGIGGQRGFIGLGFAVPSDILAGSLAQLREGGLVDIRTRARLGISAINVDTYPDQIPRHLDLPEQGVAVIQVQEGSAAEAAGLRGAEFEVAVNGQPIPVGGDVIMEVDGTPVATVGELQSLVFARDEGDTIELRIWREGELRTLEATLVPVETGQ